MEVFKRSVSQIFHHKYVDNIRKDKMIRAGYMAGYYSKNLILILNSGLDSPMQP